MPKKIAFSVLFLAIFGMLPAMTALAADDTWTQTDWTGGTDGGSGPTHPTDQTGWNKFSSITGMSGTDSPGNAVLSKTTFSATDDGSLSTTGFAKGGEFFLGTTVNTTVSGDGVDANVTQTHATVGGNVFDTTQPDLPGGSGLGATLIRNGGDDEIFVLPGSSTKDFYKYSISGKKWTKLASVPAEISSGAALLRNGDDNDIYVIQGYPGVGPETSFFRYSISGNSWTTLASAPGISGPGAKLIRNGSDNDIYLLQAQQYDGFFRYSISANSWTKLAVVPGAPYLGADVIRHGSDDAIYVLQGSPSKNFFRYSISGNAWTKLAATPDEIGLGASLVRNGSDDAIYALEGVFRPDGIDGTGFFRYSISSNSWTRLASLPWGVDLSASMIRNGGDDEIYVLPADNMSGTSSLFRYSVSSDSWTALAKTPSLVTFGVGMLRNGADDSIFILSFDKLWRYSIKGSGTPTPGTFTSAVIDLGSNVSFGDVSWPQALPPGTTLTLATRSGSTSTPDGTWSAFSPELSNPAGNAITSPAGRFIQYRATFGSSGNGNMATLNSVTIDYFALSKAGSLLSSKFDTTEANNAIGGLSWTEGALPAGTLVTVRLRTAQSVGGFIDNWQTFTDSTAGCSKSSGTVTCPASAIPVPLTDGGDNRFIQYELKETTSNGAITPSVGNVVVTYYTTPEQPPNTLIDSRPSGRLSINTATFTFHGTETGSVFECKLDLGSFAPCISPKNYTGLPDGPHAFQVRAIDDLENADATPTTAKWSVDTTPPNTIITPPRPSGSVNPNSATFTFIATHTTPTGNTFECKLKGLRFSEDEFEPCSSPKTYSELPDGVYTFSVRATDTAGNTDPTPTIARWAVGPAGPNTLIDLRPRGRIDDTSASFTFHATENGKVLTDATFECKLDSAAFAPCTAPKNYTGIPAGEHRFLVRATDAAGLTDATPTTADWRIGVSPP